ncbi:MAG: hypothetical protein ACJA08_002576 [Cyclobacteriaceae bacterium]|jgi:hypothetical protein
MIFNDLDKQSASAICTLAKLVGNIEKHENHLITVAQQLGIPKEDTLNLLSECDDLDIIRLENENQKREFINNCFSYLSDKKYSASEEMTFYNKVVQNLGMNPSSPN